MRKLRCPTDSVQEGFGACISSYRSEEQKERLAQATPILVQAERDFQEKAEKRMIHQIPTHVSVGGIVTGEEMTDIYKSKFAHQKGPGRKYYDAYLLAAPQNICPLCGVRPVSTLDHYLPKSRYPTFAVTPINLVPSCMDCNLGSKKSALPDRLETAPLHPYFDDVEQSRWLTVKLELVYTDLVPSYFASKPDVWDNGLFSRVQYHLSLYRLPTLYGTHAAEEISNCRFKWARMYRKCGQAGLAESLAEDCRSREQVHLNSWQSALYRALSKHVDLVCAWLDTAVP